MEKWKSVRVWKCESVRVEKWKSVRVALVAQLVALVA